MTIDVKSKIKFTSQEKRELFIAVLILTIMFTLNHINIFNIIIYPTINELLLIPAVIFQCFVAALTGFLLHELGHKVTAQLYGCWAEFRINYQGLFIGLLISLSGLFLFFLPGAVYIYGNLDDEKNGKIALWGPLVNLIIGSIFLVLNKLLLLLTQSAIISFLTNLCYFTSIINLTLALFNLIPIYPLDGKKILDWDILIFVLVFSSSIALLVIFYIF